MSEAQTWCQASTRWWGSWGTTYSGTRSCTCTALHPPPPLPSPLSHKGGRFKSSNSTRSCTLQPEAARHQQVFQPTHYPLSSLRGKKGGAHHLHGLCLCTRVAAPVGTATGMQGIGGGGGGGGGVRKGGAGVLAAAGSLLTTEAVSPDGLVGPREAASERAPSSPSSSRATQGPGSQSMHHIGGSGASTRDNRECVGDGGLPAGFLGVHFLWEVRSVALICINCFVFSRLTRVVLQC